MIIGFMGKGGLCGWSLSFSGGFIESFEDSGWPKSLSGISCENFPVF